MTEFGPLVLRVCRAVLNHGWAAEAADDAWSETFLAALRAYPELPADTNMEAWLVRVAHRKAVDQHRARARRPVPTDVVPDRPAPHTDGHPELWEALAALPEKQRLTVGYHHLAGLPYAQIGELLGTSEAAARRSAADGVKALRGRLAATASRHITSDAPPDTDPNRSEEVVR